MIFMRITLKSSAIALGLICLLAPNANAQLSKNPDKFLGNITTRYQVDYGNEAFHTLWNQITCENETKWSSVEGSRRGSFSWNDAAYNYAKSHNFPFKFHTLIWGSQYPSWMDNLSTSEQYKAIVEWYDAAKAHYPDLAIIDVVNEAVAGHAPAPYKNALGGDGKTGYDWIIKAFELAYERWPNAILVYNDYNTFQWQKTQFIDLVRTLRDAGAPIDAYGCQSHDLTDMSFSDFKSAMTEIQNALKMPMYSTEYDIGTTDDALQEQQYKNQIKYMWESDYCAGITLWGYIYGTTWTTDGNSGIIRDGQDRPAMTWLRQYMATDAAKTAKSPFPGMKKPISLYIKPESVFATKNDTMPITIRARMVDSKKSIDSIKFYVNNSLYATFKEAPYVVNYVPKSTGKFNLKAVVYSDSTTYERLGSFTAYNPRSTFKTMSLPGTVQAEDFDISGEGMSFHDSDSQNEGTSSYRSNGGGVDIVSGGTGYAIGYTQNGEWLEYTVNVTKAGYYTYEAYASSGTTNSGFRLSISGENGLTDITDNIVVPQTGNNDWGTYTSIIGRTLIKLNEGKQIIRLTITGNNCNVDKITFKHVEVDNTLNIRMSANPAPATVGTASTISFTPTNSSREGAIKYIRVYVNGDLKTTVSAKPFQYKYTPTAKGTVTFNAIAIDTLGHESDIAKLSLKVNNKRTTYTTSPVSIPGTIQAENFDKGGEGVSFHDSDSNDEGKANYRSDNEGVDIVTGNGGYAIGYTAANEWLEYTVKVTTTSRYSFTATVSSGNDNSGFRIGLMKDGKETTLANVAVPNGGSWDTYTTKTGTLSLTEGTNIIRITITGAYCNIDKIAFSFPAGVEYVTQDDYDAAGTRYNLGGAIVGDSYNGITIKNGKKYLEIK